MSTSTQFYPINFYKKREEHYHLLPFNFRRRSNGTVLLTNISGEFISIPTGSFEKLVQHQLEVDSKLFNKLRSRHFLCFNEEAGLDRLASKLWTKKSILQGFSRLHIFVLTLRCNCACTYCQASRQSKDATSYYDMSIESARKSVDLMMQCPAKDITVEFQGGEPLLNFDVLKEIVHYCKKINQTAEKNLSFVACTNLSLATDEVLQFFKDEGISVSTSVDGPAKLHDFNRCRAIKSACHSVVVEKIKKARDVLGRQNVSALMTTTRESLKYPKEIVDEYLKLDLGSIFVRALNPYGYAVKTEKAIGYSTEEFVTFYKQILDYIIEVNRKGIVFPEAYAPLLLRKMLTPWPVGFVDLQSPTGNGFAVTVYNYDGDVYASDESRMLSEMGDPHFRLGSALTDSYEEIFFGKTMQSLATNGIAETLAGCCDCAYVPYCGADPVRNYATQKDEYGNRPSSSFCQKNKAIFDILFEIWENADSQLKAILWSWLRDCSPKEIDLNACPSTRIQNA